MNSDDGGTRPRRKKVTRCGWKIFLLLIGVLRFSFDWRIISSLVALSMVMNRK